MVETLVAISILLIVIIGPMTIAQKGIQNAYFARDQLTAVFLAQEAIEAVREKRDDQALHVYNQLVDEDSPSDFTWDWMSAIPTECTTSDGCKFDPGDDENFNRRTFKACGTDACKLQITDTGAYTYDAGNNPSIFTRKVYIEDHGNSAKVRVVVTWNATAFAGAERTVEFQTWLYDRYQHYQSS